LIEYAHKSLLAYCHMVSPEFISADHHRLIAKHLQQTLTKPKRLIVSMPPRHGKSFLITEHFPTWFLGREPSKNVISASYGQDLANDFGRKVRNRMESETYGSIFDTRVAKDSHSKKRFDTTDGGSYFAVGKGGPITGRGGDVIIVDDLIKSDQEARSETYRQGIYSWWKETLYTRMMPGASIIVVATRWHEEDLTGWLLNNSKQDWEHLCLPAISPEGKALWPEMYPIEVLREFEQETELSFESLYQQNPVKPEGNMIKRDWINYYTELPRVIQQKVMTWDLAFKGNKDSDYVVGQVWGRTGADAYLIDQVRGQWDFTETLFHFEQLCAKHPDCYNRIIEDAANSAALISTMQRKISGITAWKPRTDKVGRVKAVTPMFRAGNVHIPSTNLFPWVEDMTKEWFSFDQGKNDDTVDAMTMALINLEESSGTVIMGVGTRDF